MNLNEDRKIAYFSMEIGLHPDMPTYSGGLGILAGDTIRAATDLQMPMVAVTLLHRKGYFQQELDSAGGQTEQSVTWDVEQFLVDTGARTEVTLEGRQIHVRAMRFDVSGKNDFCVPVYLLDTDLPENSDWDRQLTDHLYGGDQHYRLCQEAILGIGGVRLLQALGYQNLDRFHMNEGHASLLALELLDQHAARSCHATVNIEDVNAVRKQCVFTTHTPVKAGHDQFPLDLAKRVLGEHDAFTMEHVFCCDGMLNMTYLALNLSEYVNGVAKKHGEVSRLMFAHYKIDSITNGVHGATWASRPMATLFDQHIPGWREDNFSFRYALNLSNQDVWQAHQESKQELLDEILRVTSQELDPGVLTLGFARRATPYTRPGLLFHDLNRLRSIAKDAGKLQVVFAGKAHPHDDEGKDLIRNIVRIADELKAEIPIVYLPNYGMRLGQLITAGVDIWLNTPKPPLEASGTSGMKAAINGVPSLSVLDGWWIEGCIEGVTGWAIGSASLPSTDSGDAESLYHKLEQIVFPMYYHDRPGFIEIMRHAIALNGSFFNTHRMVQQYAQKAYL
jgi:starch phosphorylase